MHLSQGSIHPYNFLVRIVLAFSNMLILGGLLCVNKMFSITNKALLRGWLTFLYRDQVNLTFPWVIKDVSYFPSVVQFQSSCLIRDSLKLTHYVRIAHMSTCLAHETCVSPSLYCYASITKMKAQFLHFWTTFGITDFASVGIWNSIAPSTNFCKDGVGTQTLAKKYTKVKQQPTN